MLQFVMGVVSPHYRKLSLIDLLWKTHIYVSYSCFSFSQMYVSYITYSKNEIVTTDKSSLARNLSAQVYSQFDPWM